MSVQLPDYPEYIAKSESLRQRQQEALAFDIDEESPLASEIKALIEEMEDIQEELRSIWDLRYVHTSYENLSLVKEQKRRLAKFAR